MLLSRGALWALLTATACALNNRTTPVSFFYSRPDLLPPIMTVNITDAAASEPGYVFITPYQQPQAGPYIYDKLGNLVWSGWADIGPFNAHNFFPCEYLNEQHLCMFQGNQLFGYARGHAIILNQDYKIVKTIEAVGDVPPLDQHELRLVEGGKRALITIYQQVPYDLSRLDIDGAVGWVMNSIFQEINVEDNSLVFEWNSLNHVEPWISYVYPRSSDISGTGEVAQSPWDYFHINSVDKSKRTGNYLISARHLGALYMINATDGSTIWTLESGGKSDFHCIDFAFAFQHDAEIQYEDERYMNISMYDNSSNNANRTAPHSTGKFINLDFETMTARLYRPSTYHPEGMLSASQGNTQVLANGNAFHSFGDWPRFTEHAPDGRMVWEGRIGPDQGENMVYRAYSSPWKSVPTHSKPSLWTYSRTSDSPVAFYVSWNGATEVRHWNFYGANDVNDYFGLIGSTEKRGFETVYSSETHFTYTFVEAMSAAGVSLRNSSMVMTFLPSAQLAANCNEMNCHKEEAPPPPPPPPPPPRRRT